MNNINSVSQSVKHEQSNLQAQTELTQVIETIRKWFIIIKRVMPNINDGLPAKNVTVINKATSLFAARRNLHLAACLPLRAF